MKTCAVLAAVLVHGVAAQQSVHAPCGAFEFLWEPLGQDCTKYGLYAFNSEDVHEVLTVATRDNTPEQVPDSLLGLHYMDKNPLEDEVLSFAGCTCPEDDPDQACYIKVYGERVWSWGNNFSGKLLYDLARRVFLTYKITFSSDKKYAHIAPTSGGRVEVPDVFVDFDMYLVDDNNNGGQWIRNTTFAGRSSGDYNFRRIVDEFGEKTPNFEKFYLANIGREDRTLDTTQQYAKVLTD